MKMYYDLHIHSCLSPCGDEDMTPGNICGMAMLAGLKIVALTDHNTSGNCRSFCRHAQNYGLIPLCGMELTTREEVHVVCLFSCPDKAENFSNFVYTKLLDTPNKPNVFGRQLYCNEKDECCGELTEKLLISATEIGIYDVCHLMKTYDGIAFPAHINRNSFSLLSNLGLWDDAMGFGFCEVYNPTQDELNTMTTKPVGSKIPIPMLVDSDAHRLTAIQDAAFSLDIKEPTPTAVISALREL